MDNGTNPGSRPRKGIVFALVAFAVAGIVAAAAVVSTPRQAAAAGLESFTSCRELSRWGAATEQRDGAWSQFDAVTDGGVAEQADTAAGGSATASRAPVTTLAANEETTGARAADEQAVDGTNVVVDGVDELDLVDRLGGDRVLVVAGQKLAIVDLGAAKVLATRAVGYGAQVTFDREHGRVWVVGPTDDGAQVEVVRFDVGADTLAPAGTWRTPGQLVDARRIGDQLHLVASDGFSGPAGPQVPFGGDPVPCEQVLHPAGWSDPTASLIVTLPVSGELTPVHATEVVGSGQLVHVTDAAAYLATPQWGQAGGETTTIHRFDLASLTYTGSGSVPGSLLNDFSMSDQDGYLRVAVTVQGAGGVATSDALPMAGGDASASQGTRAPVVAETADPDTTVPETAVPDTSVPDTTLPGDTTTSTEVAGATTSTSTTSTSTSTSTTSTSTSTTSTTAPTGVTIAGPGPGDPVNRVVVLDTEGNLDVVGATPWFGHPGETLQGIRFDGDIAYAVTFLQTDPFYVLDLADPTAPTVAGEVELPGFSAYLHPVGDGRVVGFGPGASGRQEAKLFDVSDPTAPKVVDDLLLGDDSPVVYDHHAFVSLGDGRFAVPVTSWGEMVTDCVIPEDIGPAVDGGCAPSSSGASSEVVEVEVDGDSLREVDRVTVHLPEQASRAIPTEDGWAVLAGSSIGTVAADGTQGPTVTI